MGQALRSYHKEIVQASKELKRNDVYYSGVSMGTPRRLIYFIWREGPALSRIRQWQQENGEGRRRKQASGRQCTYAVATVQGHSLGSVLTVSAIRQVRHSDTCTGS